MQLDETDPTPRDLVGPKPMTLDDFAALNDLVGQFVECIDAPEVFEDADGIPSHVGKPKATAARFDSACFMVDEVTRLGGSPRDFPNIEFYDRDGNRV